MNTKFKKYNRDKIEDLTSYLKDYINKIDGEVEIMIGSDSQANEFWNNATFVEVICIYTRGKGAHVIFKQEKRVRVHGKNKQEKMMDRLWQEIYRAVDVATFLRDQDILDISKVKAIDVQLHLDINKHSEHESNKVHDNAVGYVNALGFDCHTKPDAPAASFAADHICRGYHLKYH